MFATNFTVRQSRSTLYPWSDKKKVFFCQYKKIGFRFTTNKMGKNNKKGNKANVFKVAGAKSLKKTKTKAVNLGLKNIKQTVVDIDKQFVEINKKPKTNKKPAAPMPKVQKKKPENVSKEDVAKTVEKIVKMDL